MEGSRREHDRSRTQAYLHEIIVSPCGKYAADLLTCFHSESCGPKSKLVETTGSISQEVLDQEREMLKEWCLYDTEDEV
jgi:hypothetical protein